MDSYQPGLLAKLRRTSFEDRKILLASLELTLIECVHIWHAAAQIPDVRALVAKRALLMARTLDERITVAESLRERPQRKVIRIIQKDFTFVRDEDLDPNDIERLMNSTCRCLRRLGRRRLAARQRLADALAH
jgi:hypothetical protein